MELVDCSLDVGYEKVGTLSPAVDKNRKNPGVEGVQAVGSCCSGSCPVCSRIVGSQAISADHHVDNHLVDSYLAGSHHFGSLAVGNNGHSFYR
jgi:epoxyqueuosine reductase QueG